MLLRFTVFTFVICFSQFGIAAEVENLYQAQTIVTGTEEPERTRGFRQALKDVLIKLTGDIRLEKNDQLQTLFAQPHSFVASFEYEDRMKDIPVHDEQGTRERPHFLRVVFKKDILDAEMRRLNLRKWSSNRPTIAIWLGVSTARGDYLLTSSGTNGYGQRAVLIETASRRGLPIRLPSAQKSTVHFEDVANVNIKKLKAASSGTETLLIGTLSITPDGNWDITWTLRHALDTKNWKLKNVSFDRALKNGLQIAALFLRDNARQE